MVNTRYDIKIKPLFNQALPEVWENFAEIEMAARAEYGHIFMDGAFANLLSGYREDWKKASNIAFAAYERDKMVGFIKGYMIDRHEYKLDSLFVNPDVQRQGIGGNLLCRFENAASLYGSYVQGFCYDWARSFYKKHDYTIIRGKTGSIEISKKLPHTGKGVVPLFNRWKVRDFRPKYTMIPVDADLLRGSFHQPLFVNVNENCEIDVVGVKTKDGADVIWLSDNMPESLKMCREMSVRWQLDSVNSR